MTVDIDYGIDTMNEPLKYKSIVYHELGHIFHNHAMKVKAYKIIGNAIVIACLVALMSLTIPDKDSPVDIMKMVLYSSALDVLLSYSSHVYQQLNEFQADRFSFQYTGTGEHLIEAISEIRLESSITPVSRSAYAVYPPYFMFNTHPSLYHRYKHLKD